MVVCLLRRTWREEGREGFTHTHRDRDKSNKREKADLFLLGGEDDTLVLLLEPLLGIVLLDLVVESDAGLGSSALGDALSGAVEDDVEVHTVDTDGGIVLKTKIDVLVNTEAKVSGGAEVVVKQLKLLDAETLLDELEGLGTTDGGVDGDLLVTADTELSDGVASFFSFSFSFSVQLLEFVLCGAKGTDTQRRGKTS